MEGAGPKHGWRRARPIKILAAAAVAVFLAAAGTTVLLPHARPGRILVHVLPVGQDMSSATAIAADGPDVWVANETDRGGGSVTELNASNGSWIQTLSDGTWIHSLLGGCIPGVLASGGYHFSNPGLIAAVGTHIWVFGSNGVTVLTAPVTRPRPRSAARTRGRAVARRRPACSLRVYVRLIYFAINGQCAQGGGDVSRTRYARNGELRIAYELRGKLNWRRPWLVLVQGMALDRSGWGPVLAKLRRHFRLVLVDNRGSGRSGLPAASFDVADMAADVVAVLDGAGIRRAHVMGASLGGMVAQELAIDHPERVDALVLASTTPGWPFAYPMPAASLRLIAAAGSMTREVALRRHVENALSVRGGEREPGLADRLVEHQRSRQAAPGAWPAQAAAGARYAGLLRQTRIRARTLVLQGAADTVVDPRNGRLLASRIPGAQLVIFPELGHLLFWQEPDGFADVVTLFLLAGAKINNSASAAVPGSTGHGRRVGEAPPPQRRRASRSR